MWHNQIGLSQRSIHHIFRPRAGPHEALRAQSCRTQQRSTTSLRPREAKASIPSRADLCAEEELVAFIQRVSGALCGICALFAPVLIMIFVPSLPATLAITFSFVLLVAGGIAWFTDLTAAEVLGLSFAYAAVFAVFIGSASTAHSSNTALQCGICCCSAANIVEWICYTKAVPGSL